MNVIIFDFPGKTKNFQSIGSIDLFYDIQYQNLNNILVFKLDIGGKSFDYWIAKKIIENISDYIDENDINILFLPYGNLSLKKFLTIEYDKEYSFFIELTSTNFRLFTSKQFIYFLEKNNWNNLQEMLDLNTFKK